MAQAVRSGLFRWSMRTAMAALCIAPCFAQIGSPESAARVVQLTGQVSVLRDNSPWALHVGDLVNTRQMIKTGADGFAILEISDGSRFEVFPNSQVVFRENPGNWKDLLDLVLGRVKVHIQKLGGRPNPTSVHTPTAVISVRGTVFDVSMEDTDTTLVAVEEGQVAVRHRLQPQSEPKLLNAGDYIRVYRNQPLATKSVDKGAAIQRGLRAAADVFYSIIYRPSGSGGGTTVPRGGGGGGSAPLPGDTGGTPPPPPPPPPPPTDGGATPPPPPPGA
jgi:FecR-like protein